MRGIDSALYGLHAVFWGAFGLVLLARRRPATQDSALHAPLTADAERVAPFSRSLVALHGLVFVLLYYAVTDAILRHQVPALFVGQRLLGALIIAAGSLLAVWTLLHFDSWRLRAKLDSGHQLATGGPFRILRHPIYAGLNLLALGTAVWVPTGLAWVAFALVVLCSDLRARAEEALLKQAFGNSYEEYCARTRRFVPWVY
jgi:protein-S-isoprenylcysteine O-methyltransferase Ste14